MDEPTRAAPLAALLARKGEAVPIPAGAGPLSPIAPQTEETRAGLSSGNGGRPAHDLVRLIARRPDAARVGSAEANDWALQYPIFGAETQPATSAPSAAPAAANAQRTAPRRRQLTVRLDLVDFVRLRDFVEATDVTYQSVLSRATLDYIARAAR